MKLTGGPRRRPRRRRHVPARPVERRDRRHAANGSTRTNADGELAITLPAKWSFARCLVRRTSFPEDPSQLVAKCGTVVVPVHGHSMLHGSLQKLLLTVGRYRDRAIHFAWKFTAVYVFASHDDLPVALPMGAVCRLHQAPGRTQVYRSACSLTIDLSGLPKAGPL